MLNRFLTTSIQIEGLRYISLILSGNFIYSTHPKYLEEQTASLLSPDVSNCLDQGHSDRRIK